ncbi:MAG: hypothetical protein ABSD99_05165 [Candidatus Bathyarchaeia archaeon]|jgi:hypothetical protein
MTSQRTVLFVALILVSPLTITLPLTTLTSSHSTGYTTSEETTLTATSVVLRTYFGSTKGTTIVQAPMDLPPKVIGFVAPKGKCSQYTLPVTLTSDSILNLKMTSTNPANLYLLPTYTFQTSADGCSLVGGAILTESNFTDYTMHWVAPEDGVFYLLVTGPTTTIMLSDGGSTHPVKQNGTVTFATSTETNFNDYSSTSTTIYTTTITSASPLYLQLPTLPSLGIVGLAIAGLAIILIAIFRRRRG